MPNAETEMINNDPKLHDDSPGELVVNRDKLPTPAEGFGYVLMDILKDKDIPADKLALVLQMQKDLIHERQKEAFQVALVALHAELPQVEKHGWVPKSDKAGYAYALWEDMDEAIRPHLATHGFALTFAEIPTTNGHVHMRGTLIHEAGHAIHTERMMPPDKGPGRNANQEQGSSISYAKRYLAEELLNIVRKGEDKDGATLPNLLSKEQVLELENLLEATGTLLEPFLAMFVTGVERLEDVPARDFARLKNSLEAKRKRQLDSQ